MTDSRRADTRTRQTQRREASLRRQPAAAIAGRAPTATGPRIEITPTEAQYEQLCRDLKKLRRRGAPSNTDAILEAVRDAATGGKVGGRPHKGREERSPAPRSSNRR